MSPRRSGQESIDYTDYPSVLTKLCREMDVLIIPIIRPRPSFSDLRDFPRRVSEPGAPPPTEIDGEEDGGCPPPLPPTAYVIYDESGDNPIGVICKSFYVEYAFIQAFFSSINNFATLSCLRIEDCCVSRDVIRVLQALMSEPIGKNITDLGLDGNSEIADELPSLLRTGLKHLSLKRCDLTDKDVSSLAEELHYDSGKGSKLLSLNLNMNLIGDEGAFALANALRSNRTLVSLSLCGNLITDVGCGHLIQALGKFSLTHEEIMERRRRNFDRLMMKKSLIDKLLEQWRLKNEAESQLRVKSSEKVIGKKSKSFDGIPKRALTSSRDKKRSTVESREKVRGRRKTSGMESNSGVIRPNASEMREIMIQVESEMPPNRHPLTTEVNLEGDDLICEGCWKLGNLNLSYNRITEVSLNEFVNLLYYQDKAFKSHGLARLIIQPGNEIPEDSCKLAELKCLLQARCQRRGSDAGQSQTDAPVSRRNTSPRKRSLP